MNIPTRPMCGAMIADLFSPKSRGVANGIFSWGVYVGFGMAFVLGINVTNVSSTASKTKSDLLNSGQHCWLGLESPIHHCCCTRACHRWAIYLHLDRPQAWHHTSAAEKHEPQSWEQNLSTEVSQKLHQPGTVAPIDCGNGKAHCRAYLGLQHQALLPELSSTLWSR